MSCEAQLAGTQIRSLMSGMSKLSGEVFGELLGEVTGGKFWGFSGGISQGGNVQIPMLSLHV